MVGNDPEITGVPPLPSEDRGPFTSDPDADTEQNSFPTDLPTSPRQIAHNLISYSYGDEVVSRVIAQNPPKITSQLLSLELEAVERALFEKEIITIDGPSGAGKSTEAAEAARVLGLPHLDTGALYRCLALECKRQGLIGKGSSSILDLPQTARSILINNFDVEFILADQSLVGSRPRVMFNGQDVTTDIRTKEMDSLVSMVSPFPEVREIMNKIQRAWASTLDVGCVTEGRDQAEVFSQSKFHFYLDASPEVRAARRARQRNSGDEPSDAQIEDALKDIEDRDRRDRTREVGALKEARDAIKIDSSSLSPGEVLEELITAIIQRRQEIEAGKKLPPLEED